MDVSDIQPAVFMSQQGLLPAIYMVMQAIRCLEVSQCKPVVLIFNIIPFFRICVHCVRGVSMHAQILQPADHFHILVILQHARSQLFL